MHSIVSTGALNFFNSFQAFSSFELNSSWLIKDLNYILTVHQMPWFDQKRFAQSQRWMDEWIFSVVQTPKYILYNYEEAFIVPC